MKDSRKKYIIVDGKDINITIREQERVAGFNDFWNEYKATGHTTAKNVFEKYQIPEQFQKIVFCFPACSCCKHSGKEVLTSRPFSIFKNNKSQEFTGYEYNRWFNGDIIWGSVKFNTSKTIDTYATVLSFYEQLTEEGYLEQYISAIKNIFFVKNELQINGETTKVEDAASNLLKSNQKIKK